MVCVVRTCMEADRLVSGERMGCYRLVRCTARQAQARPAKTHTQTQKKRRHAPVVVARTSLQRVVGRDKHVQDGTTLVARLELLCMCANVCVLFSFIYEGGLRCVTTVCA